MAFNSNSVPSGSGFGWPARPRLSGMMFQGLGGGQQIVAGDAPPMDLGDFGSGQSQSQGGLFGPISARADEHDVAGLGEQLANAETRKPRAFEQGGVGRQILGSLGDGLLAISGIPGAQMLLQNSMATRRAAADRRQQLEDEDRQRQQRQAFWLQQQDYKQNHPDDQFTQYIRAAGIDPSSPQGQELYRKRTESMVTPPTVAVDGFDAQGNPTKTFMPRAAIGSSVGGAPPSDAPPAGFVRNGYRFKGGNYKDRSNWVPVGGASSSGGATFR